VPIHEYKCRSCRFLFEELFLGSTPIPEEDKCPECGGVSAKVKVSWFRHVGPVFEDLDSYTSNMYTKKQRAAGKEIRSYKDVKKFEQDNNLCRISPGSSIHRHSVESVREEQYEMSRVENDCGREGVADYIYKKEMQDSTGWSDSKYATWKTMHDKTQSSAQSGKVDISQMATSPLKTAT